MTQELTALSIVIPVYNEAPVLPSLFQELDRVRSGELRGVGKLEIILVDDGSTDTSWNLITAQCQRDSVYVGVKLSRGFGQQLALAAGLEASRGQAVVSMDADLQDPPDVIPQLLAAHRRGYDIVYATRRDRGKEPWCKRTAARLFYYVLGKFSGVPIPSDTGDFRLMSRRSLVELSKLQESHRLFRGLLPWIGFPQTRIVYDRGDRVAGETHYSWHKMLRLAIDGITSMSQMPLRLAYAASLILFGVFVTYILYVVATQHISGGPLLPGWTTIMIAITVFGTTQLLLLGIFGEYLGRVYEQVKNRPPYIVQEIQRADVPTTAELTQENRSEPPQPHVSDRI